MDIYTKLIDIYIYITSWRSVSNLCMVRGIGESEGWWLSSLCFTVPVIVFSNEYTN
jgi:hypothetical protein